MPLILCCVHDKPRRVEALEEMEHDKFRCRVESLCHVGRNERFDPSICCVHKKKRKPEFMVEIEDGIFRCKDNDRCKGDNSEPLTSTSRVPSSSSWRPPINDDRHFRDFQEDERDSKRRRFDNGPLLSYNDRSHNEGSVHLTDEQRAQYYQEGMRLMALAMGGTIPAAVSPFLGNHHLNDSRGQRRRSPSPPVRNGSYPERRRSNTGLPVIDKRTEMCDIHNKPRTLQYLTSQPGGRFRCTAESPCKVNNDSASEMCHVHNKSRLLSFLEVDSDGRYHCTSSSICKGGI